MNGLEYKEIYSSESWGSYGGFGLKILVATTASPDLKSESIWKATHDASELISSEVQALIIAGNEAAREQAKRERAELLGLFPGKIFVEEVPNGYCPKWCCRHLPWFIVTTEVGRFKIGWRKRVINIDWTETVGTESAYELFSNEDVTKGNRYIHAWNLDKAREYIAAIMETAKTK